MATIVTNAKSRKGINRQLFPKLREREKPPIEQLWKKEIAPRLGELFPEEILSPAIWKRLIRDYGLKKRDVINLILRIGKENPKVGVGICINLGYSGPKTFKMFGDYYLKEKLYFPAALMFVSAKELKSAADALMKVDFADYRIWAGDLYSKANLPEKAKAVFEAAGFDLLKKDRINDAIIAFTKAGNLAMVEEIKKIDALSKK